MSPSDDTRDRLIRLESEVEHLTEKVVAMSGQVGEMHQLLTKAQGAKWAILGLATLGGFISAKFTAIVPWLGQFPR